jgi:hypothetical protein
MLRQTPVEILGDAGIEAAISAFQNIDDPVHSALCFTHTGSKQTKVRKVS